MPVSHAWEALVTALDGLLDVDWLHLLLLDYYPSLDARATPTVEIAAKGLGSCGSLSRGIVPFRDTSGTDTFHPPLSPRSTLSAHSHPLGPPSESSDVCYACAPGS